MSLVGMVSRSDLRDLDSFDPAALGAAVEEVRGHTTRIVAHASDAKGAWEEFKQHFQVPGVEGRFTALLAPASSAAGNLDEDTKRLQAIAKECASDLAMLKNARGALAELIANFHASVPAAVASYSLRSGASSMPSWTEVPILQEKESEVRADVERFNASVEEWERGVAAKIVTIGKPPITALPEFGGEPRGQTPFRADPLGPLPLNLTTMWGGHRDGDLVGGWNAPKANMDFWENLLDPSRYVYLTSGGLDHIGDGHADEFHYFASEQDGPNADWREFATWCIQMTVTDPSEKPKKEHGGRTLYRRLMFFRDPETGEITDEFMCNVVVEKNGSIVTAFPDREDLPYHLNDNNLGGDPYK